MEVELEERAKEMFDKLQGALSFMCENRDDLNKLIDDFKADLSNAHTNYCADEWDVDQLEKYLTDRLIEVSEEYEKIATREQE